VDHRTLVGAEKRAKTREQLLKGALRVFTSHGVDAKVIDLIIREAGVARGTFYNYFKTNEELFVEVAKEVSDEIIRIVHPLVEQQKDAAARVACGVTSVIKMAISYPAFAQFIVRGGPPALKAGGLVSEVVPRDIDAGIASGRFSIADRGLALDMILGAVIMGFHTVLSEKVSKQYPNMLAQAVLQSLGVSKTLAHKYAFQDFGKFEIAEDSLFVQASA
jgi:AcrR family transcriptional regulator